MLKEIDVKVEHKVYKDLVVDLVTEVKDTHETVAKSRNVKQVQNRKAKVEMKNNWVTMQY